MYEEYAKLGVTTYTYKDMDGSGMISAYDLQKCAEQLHDATLVDQFNTYFLRYDSYTDPNNVDNDSPITRSIQYYTIDPENGELCRDIQNNLYERYNAVAFPILAKTSSLKINGTLSDAARQAAHNVVQLGWITADENNILQMRDTISSGQVCQILCRFLASMTNVYR